MAKVLYNGELIELKDELERGELELDLITENDKDVLEDTIEIDFKLEDTLDLSKELSNYDEHYR